MTLVQRRLYILTGAIIFTVLFLLLAINYHDPALKHIGKVVQNNLYDAFGSYLRDVFIVITYLGSGYISYPLTAILVVIVLFRKQPWIALILVYNLISVRTLNWLLKTLFAVPRPELEHLVSVGYYSFPSGHAMNSTAFFGLIAYLLNRQLRKIGKRPAYIWPSFAILILLICLSRVYLGVHYPMDVIGGAIAGGVMLFITLFVYTFTPMESEHAERGR